jgi:drug/metabolite transporter (DMT)-like permease
VSRGRHLVAPLIAQVLSVLIWSTTIVVSAAALTTTSPAVLTMVRFALAAALLVPLALRNGAFAATFRSPVTAVLGLTGVSVYYGLQAIGLLYTTPGTAALMQALLPVSTTAWAMLLVKERPVVGTAFGLVLVTVGVVFVASGGSAHVDVGAALIAVGVIAYALYTVLLRRVGSRRGYSFDPIALSAATSLWGLAFLAPWQVWEIATGRAQLPTGVLAFLPIAYLGVVGSGVTLLLWTFGASRTPANVSGVLTAVIPALGYAVAVLTGEPLMLTKVAGGVLAVTGVLVATQAEVRHASSRPASAVK